MSIVEGMRVYESEAAVREAHDMKGTVGMRRCGLER